MVSAETTPQNTSKSHVVSHHSAVAMDTHIKLHHLPCPPFIAHPRSTYLNPIQSNSGIHSASPPHLLLSMPPAGRLVYTPLSLLPPCILQYQLHTPALSPSFPPLLLYTLPTHPHSLPLLSVPRWCNPIPVGPEPGA